MSFRGGDPAAIGHDLAIHGGLVVDGQVTIGGATTIGGVLVPETFGAGQGALYNTAAPQASVVKVRKRWSDVVSVNAGAWTYQLSSAAVPGGGFVNGITDVQLTIGDTFFCLLCLTYASCNLGQLAGQARTIGAAGGTTTFTANIRVNFDLEGW